MTDQFRARTFSLSTLKAAMIPADIWRSANEMIQMFGAKVRAASRADALLVEGDAEGFFGLEADRKRDSAT